jgi:hypothetical protein
MPVESFSWQSRVASARAARNSSAVTRGSAKSAGDGSALPSDFCHWARSFSCCRSFLELGRVDSTMERSSPLASQSNSDREALPGQLKMLTRRPQVLIGLMRNVRQPSDNARARIIRTSARVVELASTKDWPRGILGFRLLDIFSRMVTVPCRSRVNKPQVGEKRSAASFAGFEIRRESLRRRTAASPHGTPRLSVCSP